MLGWGGKGCQMIDPVGMDGCWAATIWTCDYTSHSQLFAWPRPHTKSTSSSYMRGPAGKYQQWHIHNVNSLW